MSGQTPEVGKRRRPGALLGKSAAAAMEHAASTQDGSWTTYGIPEPLPSRKPR